MATEKKQSFLGGAAVLAFGIVAVKIIGAVFKIPLRNILGEGGSADFSNAYNIYATLLTVSTARSEEHTRVFPSRSPSS